MDAVSGSRRSLAAEQPDVFALDPADAAGAHRYLVGRGLLTPDDAPLEISRAGDGNMNCTLRIVTPQRRLIVKQGRPWVEKYDHIPAPWDRTIVEAAFYETVRVSPAVAGRMPALLDADREARALVLEDAGGPDFSDLYAEAVLTHRDLGSLVEYFLALHRLPVEPAMRSTFANREMRALNHEHIFRFPLAASNGLDLDGITPGLDRAATALKRDAEYVERIERLGDRYLAHGDRLVHGDFFPGSWLRSARGPIVIDPEFCFLGTAEFDVGVMYAHLIMANQPASLLDAIRSATEKTYDFGLISRFAGVEIMRRLIGVAQLPLPASLDAKRALLDCSRGLVMA